MKHIHLIIPDLFLPQELAADVCRDLPLPALEKMLARGVSSGSIRTESSLEARLCELFGLPCDSSAPIATISAGYDGLEDGCWLRADPVHLNFQHDRFILENTNIDSEEASELCMTLNTHFAADGLEFLAPHPLRWYLRAGELPAIHTIPLSKALGRDMRDIMPCGDTAPFWNRVINEIQMLLHAHPVNQAREARRERPVNSVWLWGRGEAAAMRAVHYDRVSSDDVLPGMFARAAGITGSDWQSQWSDRQPGSRQLLVWCGLQNALQQGDVRLWRERLQDFEISYALPLWHALRNGKIAELRLEVLGRNLCHSSLRRTDAWTFWRLSKPIEHYSMV